MARSLKVEIIGDASSLHRAFGSAANAGTGFGRSMARFGKVAAVGLAVAGGAAVAAGGKMISLASDAGEVDSKMGVVFGRTLPGLKKDLDKFSKATGASSFKLREQAADMGALLGPLTGSKQATAQMSEQFVKLATDLGSFNNVPVDDALLAIRSGLVGESEPLRRFGVLLNEGAVKSEGLRMGLIKAGGTMTEQQKVQARASLIMKQTTQAQGDATRTAGSMANQMKKLRNTVTDTATSIGLALIPAAVAAVGAINGFIDRLKAAKGIKGKFAVVWDVAKDLAGKLRTAIAGINWTSVWAGARGIGAGFAARLGSIDWAPIGAKIVDGIAAGLKGGAKLAAGLAETVSNAVAAIKWEKVGRVAGPGLAAALVSAFATLMDPSFWARNWDLTLSVALVALGGPIGRAAGKLAGVLKNAFGKAIGDAVLSVAGHLGKLGPMFVAAFLIAERVAAGAVSKLGGAIAGAARAVAGKIGAALTFGVKVLGVQAAINTVADFAKRVFDKMKEIPSQILSLAGAVFDAAANLGRMIISGIIGGLGSLVSRVKNAIEDKLRSAINAVNPFSPIEEGAARLLGKPIGEGTVKGATAALLPLAAAITHGVRAGVHAAIAMAGSLQAQVDAVRAKQAAQDLRWGLQSAADALGAARKKHSGVLDAERAFNRARMAITIAGVEKRIAKEEAGLAKLATAFDTFKSKALSAFDAITAGFMASTDPELAAIAARRLAEDQTQAVTDAEKALAEARANGGADDIAAAERNLARAREDIRVSSLQKIGDAERAAWEASRATLRDKLDADLTALGEHLAKVGGTMKDATTKIASILGGAGLTFEQVGGKLGASFVDGLKASIEGVTITAGKVFATLHTNARKVKKMAAGGIVTRPTLALIGEAGPEAVVPLGKGRGVAGGAGDTIVNLTVNGWVGDERSLVEKFRGELIRGGRRMPGVLGGLG